MVKHEEDHSSNRVETPMGINCLWVVCRSNWIAFQAVASNGPITVDDGKEVYMALEISLLVWGLERHTRYRWYSGGGRGGEIRTLTRSIIVIITTPDLTYAICLWNMTVLARVTAVSMEFIHQFKLLSFIQTNVFFYPNFMMFHFIFYNSSSSNKKTNNKNKNKIFSLNKKYFFQKCFDLTFLNIKKYIKKY